MRIVHGLLVLSMSSALIWACASDGSGGGAATSADGGVTTTSPTATTSPTSTPADPDGGSVPSSGACGSVGPKPSIPVPPTGVLGRWVIDDAPTACENGAALFIGITPVPSVIPNTDAGAGTVSFDDEATGCAIANGVAVDYTGGRVRDCFGPFFCQAPGKELGVIVDPDAKTGSLFETPKGGPRGKLLGTLSVSEDGQKLTISGVGSAPGGRYIRSSAGGTGSCD